MTTRQNEVKRILERLTGKPADDAKVSRLANVADAVEISPGDALFPLMVALELYRDDYGTVPDAIKEASAFVLREHAEALRAESERITAEQSGQLEAHAKTMLATLGQWFTKEMPGLLRTEIEKQAAAAVRQPVGEAVESFKKAAREADSALEGMQRAQKDRAGRWVLGIVFATLLGGAVGGVTVAGAAMNAEALLSEKQQVTMAWGKAVRASWDKLPKAVQDTLGREAAKAAK